MTQLTLDFDQKEQLNRVRSKTATAILEFFVKLQHGDTFHAQQLRDYVASLVPVAPARKEKVCLTKNLKEQPTKPTRAWVKCVVLLRVDFRSGAFSAFIRGPNGGRSRGSTIPQPIAIWSTKSELASVATNFKGDTSITDRQ
jgi:hypothetical protein